MGNLAKWLEELLQMTDAVIITNIVLFIIFILFTTSIILLFLNKWQTLTNITPGLLTSLGILGTFAGIIVGLLDFDPSKIDESIELLLNGLKTAFITSLVGMTATIIYRIIGAIFSHYQNAKEGELLKIDIEPKDIFDILNVQKEHIVGVRKHLLKVDKSINSQEKYFSLIKQAISGDEESSLTGQIKLLRSEVSNNHQNNTKLFGDFSNKLWNSLSDVTEELSKSATEQMVDALSNAITNFNRELREQFGENFKALDASVEKLVIWQESYGHQVEQMTIQYAQGVKAITDIESSVTTISHESKSIPNTMAQLKSVLQTNQHQIEELSRHLEIFKAMRDQVVSAIPEMQKHVADTVNEISKSSQMASKGHQSLIKNTDEVQKSFIDKIHVIQNQLESTVTQLVEKQIQEMHHSFSALENEVVKRVEVSGEAANKQLQVIDDSLSREISKVMNHMGQALGSISGQFAKDYRELTLAMKNITEMAEA